MNVLKMFRTALLQKTSKTFLHPHSFSKRRGILQTLQHLKLINLFLFMPYRIRSLLFLVLSYFHKAFSCPTLSSFLHFLVGFYNKLISLQLQFYVFPWVIVMISSLLNQVVKKSQLTPQAQSSALEKKLVNSLNFFFKK